MSHFFHPRHSREQNKILISGTYYRAKYLNECPISSCHTEPENWGICKTALAQMCVSAIKKKKKYYLQNKSTRKYMQRT